MDFLDKQIAPPRSWEKFEDLSRSLFAAVYGDPLAVKNGTRGQRQDGVDICVAPAVDPGSLIGVQCKGKDQGYDARATIEEFDAELLKAEHFTPPLTRWIFATTAPIDTRLRDHARNVSATRQTEGCFPVDLLGWDNLKAMIAEQPAVLRSFYPEHFSHGIDAVATLRRASSDALEAIDDTLRHGEVTIVLPREANTTAARQALQDHAIARLTGEGGTGKSGIAKRIALEAGAAALVIKDNRITAATLAEHLGQLGIREAAAEILDVFAADGTAICVVDGADRLLLSDRREVVLDLFRAIRHCASASHWQIMTTARTYQGRDLVVDALKEAGFAQQGHKVTIETLTDDETAVIGRELPSFAPLLSRSDLSHQTRSLFMLRDLLRRAVAPNHVPSEVDAAESWIAGSGLTAQELAHRNLALAQLGDRLVSAPWSQPGRADFDAEGLQHLLHEGAVLQLPGRDAFRLQHDMHEDWLVARHLQTRRETLAATLLAAEQPLWWETAVRLVAQSLLERSDYQGWLSLLGNLESDSQLDPVWRRVVLIAPFVSEGSSTILPAIEPILLADNTKLLRQMLDTLLVFETRIDERVFAQFADRDEVSQLTLAGYFKVPAPRSWMPFLRWSLKHWDVWPPTLIPRLSELAAIFARATSHLESRLAKRIAEINLRWLIEIEDAKGWRDWQKRREPFDCKLERYREWEEVEERLRDSLIASVQSGAETMRAYLSRLTTMDGHSDQRAYLLKYPGRVPTLLPREWVDMCLVQFVPPRKSRKPRDPLFDYSLFAFSDLDRTGIRGDQGFFPSSPLRGGFDQLFAADPVEGLRLLHRLERRAATHWRWHSRWEDRKKPRPVELRIKGRTIALWGDEAVYRWARAILGSHVLGSAYLALDDWLVREAAADRPIAELVELVLQNHGLVASASPLIALIVDRMKAPGEIDNAGPFLGALRLWDYDIKRHLDDRGFAHRIGFDSPDSVHFEAAETSHQRYRAHQPLSHSLLLPFRLLASAAAQAEFDATRSNWSQTDLAEYDVDLDDTGLGACREERVRRCLSDSDPKQIAVKQTEQGLEVSIAPPEAAGPDIAEMRAANELAEEAAGLLNWVMRSREALAISAEFQLADAVLRAKSLVDRIEGQEANPHIALARRMCGSGVAGTAALVAQLGNESLIEEHRAWLDYWLLGMAAFERPDDFDGVALLPDDPQVLAAWGLAGLASRGQGDPALDRVVAGLATHRHEFISAAALRGLRWEERPDFVRSMHIAALDACVVDIGWWWHGDKEKARARRRSIKDNERVARTALGRRPGSAPRLPPPPDAWQLLWSKDRWYPRWLLMPSKRMLDWSKAEAVVKGIDWRHVTEDGARHAAFSAYLVGLVDWTQAYSDDSKRRDRHFPFEWANGLADAIGRFAFAHGGGEEWRSLLTLKKGHRETDLVGRYLNAVVGAMIATGEPPDSKFWKAWRPAADWIIEHDIPSRSGDDIHLSTAATAAGMVGPYFTPIPEDWPHLDTVLPTIDQWVRATKHLADAAYDVLAIAQRMDAAQRAQWFLPWVTLWAESNGPDERFWSFNGLGNKTAALLTPLASHDKEVRGKVRQVLGIMADGGAAAARRLVTSLSTRRP